MKIGYQTKYGICLCGDSLELISKLKDNSVNLVMTSPPFALQRQKDYGNKEQHEYVDWFCEFAKLVKDKLCDDGSFVIDLGGAYKKGKPIRSLYNFRLLIKLCDEYGYHLAEEFYWYNPAKLPGPIEWVNKRKIRAKDAVNTIWWLTKNEFPKADITKVLNPYSDKMKRLIENPEKYYTPKERPSGHDISKGFGNNNGGSIPSNLLQIANSESNTPYLKYCKELGVRGHSARFPIALPEFFIKYLTDENDLVVDIFAGSNTTGQAAEKLKRHWMSMELSKDYVASSTFRFAEDTTQAKEYYRSILDNNFINIDY